MACSLKNPGDCFKIPEIKAKDIYDFFGKLEKDIEHLPKDVKKAIEDTDNELKRFNINFNDAFNKTIDSAKDSLRKALDVEEFAKNIALNLAKDSPNKDNCSAVVGGLLIALGTSMQTGTAGVPNPYATYLMTTGPAIAIWACSEVYK